MYEYFLKFNNLKCFALLLGLLVITTQAASYLFLSEGIYYQSFGEKLATDRIAKMIEQSHKWQWLGYLFIPILVLIRVSFTTICLYTGLFVADLKVRLRDLFKVALLADFVFVAAGIVKLVMLIFFKEVNTLDDLQFQPLSLMQLFDKGSVDALLVYPLGLLNAFELLYWLAQFSLVAQHVE